MKAKRLRIKWWNDLTPEQQADYIALKRRRGKPAKGFTAKQLKKYPWYLDGVNSSNKARWLRTIYRQNPWLLT